MIPFRQIKIFLRIQLHQVGKKKPQELYCDRLMNRPPQVVS